MTKYSVMPDATGMKKGDRFVVDAHFRHVVGGDPVRLPAAVLTYMGEKPVSEFSRGRLPKNDDGYAVDRNGTRYELQIEPGGCQPVFVSGEERRHPAWTLPLPDVSDDEIIAFTMAFRGLGQPYGLDRSQSPHSNNALFVVDEVTDELVRCRMVAWKNDTIHEVGSIETALDGGRMPIIRDDALHFIDLAAFTSTFDIEGPFATSAYAIFMKRDKLPPVAPGCLLVCGGFYCRYDKQTVLVTHLQSPMVAGHMGEGGLSQWLSPQPSVDGDATPSRIAITFGTHECHNIPLQAIQDHLKEIERAKSALIPSEALVLVMPPDKEGGDMPLHLVRMGSRGVTFFDDTGDTDEALGHTAPHEGGLWLFTNARYWSSRDDRTGEWDGGLDGDWRPATCDDLVSFDLTDADIQAEGVEGYEGTRFEDAVMGGRFTAEMMALAEAVASQDRRRTAAL